MPARITKAAPISMYSRSELFCSGIFDFVLPCSAISKLHAATSVAVNARNAIGVSGGALIRAANGCCQQRTRDASIAQRRPERLRFQTSLGGGGSGETPIPSITGPAAGWTVATNTISIPAGTLVGSADRLLQYV